MNWVRNNRFLASFLAVVLLGAAGLTFLLITSLGRYQQVATDYNTQVTELKRLQALEPYPDAQSEKKYNEVRQQYEADVTKLQAALASHEPKPEGQPLSPIQFQDKLRQVVDDVSHLAQLKGVALPENFYLGFEQYRGSPPDAPATPLLTTQLDAIQKLVNILINTKIDKLVSIKRAPLPQEGGGASSASAPAPGKPGAPAAAPGGEEVSKQTLEIVFQGLPTSFRESLNNITRDNQLYIVRALQVKNQVDKGPPREEPAASPAAAAAATPAPTAPEPGGVPNPPLPEQGPPPLHYVVGLEHLDVTARIELAKVMPPATATR